MGVSKKRAQKLFITITTKPVQQAAKENLPAVELSVVTGKDYDFNNLIVKAAKELLQR